AYLTYSIKRRRDGAPDLPRAAKLAAAGMRQVHYLAGAGPTPASRPDLAGQIPDAQRAVIAGDGQGSAVGAQRQRLHMIVEQFHMHLLARGQAPEADRLVPAAGDQRPAVGREHQDQDDWPARWLASAAGHDRLLRGE